MHRRYLREARGCANNKLMARFPVRCIAGTLIVLWLVCNAQLYRRYFPDIQMHFTQ